MNLKYRRVTGPVNVLKTNPQKLKGEHISVRILMGPTGSGKSAFIESLSSDGDLSISKDSLDSVTQAVVCYRLVNVVSTNLGFDTIQRIIMDTPGFLDTKMSESKVSQMIVNELDALRNSAEYVATSVYYFLPITDIRMGSSKRDAIRFLRAFAESFKADSIHIVTTMWNTIMSPKRLVDANERFETLQRYIPKQLGNVELHAHQFHFSMESSLSVIDHRYCAWVHSKRQRARCLNPQFRTLALRNLVERITNTYQQLEHLAEDRRSATIGGNEDDVELLGVIDEHEPEALKALSSFLDDLYDLDPGMCFSKFPREALCALPLSPALPNLGLSPPLLVSQQHLSASISVLLPPPPHVALLIPPNVDPPLVSSSHVVLAPPPPPPPPPPTTLGSRFNRFVAPLRKSMMRRK